MIELTERHLCTNILTHSNKSNGNDGKCLEGVIFLWLILFVCLIFLAVGCVHMFVAVMKHRLNPKYISSTGERTSLHQDLS